MDGMSQMVPYAISYATQCTSRQRIRSEVATIVRLASSVQSTVLARRRTAEVQMMTPSHSFA